jgi:exopolyphosphatase/guanosine-5'-triphosphate,3'-diphosphate pyrophosphatase
MSELSIEKYAAIDIGSNAIRLLIVTVIDKEGVDTHFKKTSLVRVPIRLGEDVFVHGKISENNYLRMVDAMNAYQLIMKTHFVKKYRACATSAMRDAENSIEVVEKLFKQTGVKVDIIDGNDEAALIASTDLDTYVKDDKVYLYVDVGGGSTEFTIYGDGHVVDSKSFKLGTVRIINNMATDTIWKEVEEWIKEKTKLYSDIALLGSGGNINSIYKSSDKKLGAPLSYYYLSNYYKHIKSLSYEERIFDLNMNPDRADVVIPATKIYLSAMKWSKAKNIYVPKIGLADGIIRSLYNKRMNH